MAGPTDAALRTAVVRRRIAFEANPAAFYSQFADQEAALGQRIGQAQQLVPQVTLSDGLLELISQICIGSQVDGLRADITMYKTAQTLAAWEERGEVNVDDIRRAAELVLLHRRRRQPFEEPGLDRQQLDNLIQQHQPRPGQRGGADRQDAPDNTDTEGE